MSENTRSIQTSSIAIIILNRGISLLMSAYFSDSAWTKTLALGLGALALTAGIQSLTACIKNKIRLIFRAQSTNIINAILIFAYI